MMRLGSVSGAKRIADGKPFDKTAADCAVDDRAGWIGGHHKERGLIDRLFAPTKTRAPPMAFVPTAGCISTKTKSPAMPGLHLKSIVGV